MNRMIQCDICKQWTIFLEKEKAFCPSCGMLLDPFKCFQMIEPDLRMTGRIGD